MGLPLAVPLGAMAIGAIGKLFGKRRANRQLDALLKEDPTYTISPNAQKKLGMAQGLMGARMPGAAQLERNAMTSQQNMNYGIRSAATDASQALAQMTRAQAATNNTLTGLAGNEADWAKFGIGNLNSAYDTMAQEDRNVYEDLVRRFQNKAQIRGAQAANRMGTWNDIFNIGTATLPFAGSKLFKSK